MSREQNGGVEVKPANRLERHLGGQLRRLDQFEEGVLLLERAVFGQGAPRLAHQPDGRMVHRAAAAGTQEPLRGSSWPRAHGSSPPAEATYANGLVGTSISGSTGGLPADQLPVERPKTALG